MNPGFRMLLLTTSIVSLALTAAGCGGSSSSSTDAASAATPSTSVSASEESTELPPIVACPTPAASTTPFPHGESSKLPHPGFATSAANVPVGVKGVHLLKFTTAMSLRDAVIFVTTNYPKAGWVIGDGDAEGHEADVPFRRGSVHGTLRLSGIEDCTTTWLVATVTRPGASLEGIPGLEDHDG